jgi:hypothetical protein
MVDVEVRRGHEGGAGAQPRKYRLWFVGPDGARKVAEIPLVALPFTPQTGSYQGVSEARPLWNLHGDCFVLADGGSPTLYVGRVDRAGLDSFKFAESLLRPAGEEMEPEAELLEQVGIRGPVPPPALPSVVRAIALDPAGWLWILPSQPRARTGAAFRVIRIAMRSGEIREDSVAAFPLEFARAPVFYARRSNPESGVGLLLRIGVQ